MVIRFNDIAIDRKSLTISVGYNACTFKHTRHGYRGDICIVFESICFILLGGWVSKVALFEHIYGQCAEGGPDDGIHVFDIHLLHWKKYWTRLGLRLMREKRGGIMHFSLRKTDV